jgi:hypothetical protein
MARLERAELLLRIDELQQTPRHTESDDVRRTLQQALADCTTRLAEIDELLGVDPT